MAPGAMSRGYYGRTGNFGAGGGGGRRGGGGRGGPYWNAHFESGDARREKRKAEENPEAEAGNNQPKRTKESSENSGSWLDQPDADQFVADIAREHLEGAGEPVQLPDPPVVNSADVVLQQDDVVYQRNPGADFMANRPGIHGLGVTLRAHPSVVARVLAQRATPFATDPTIRWWSLTGVSAPIGHARTLTAPRPSLRRPGEPPSSIVAPEDPDVFDEGDEQPLTGNECAWCMKRTGGEDAALARTHRLLACIIPSPNGDVPGCPRCNTCDHFWDTCPNHPEVSDEGWTTICWSFLVRNRAGLPPVRTRESWPDIALARPDLKPPHGFPATKSYTLAEYQSNPARFRNYYRAGGDEGRFLADPKTADLASVEANEADLRQTEVWAPREQTGLDLRVEDTMDVDAGGEPQNEGANAAQDERANEPQNEGKNEPQQQQQQQQQPQQPRAIALYRYGMDPFELDEDDIDYGQ